MKPAGRLLLWVALAGVAAPMADAEPAPLAPLGFLAGSCWKGEFPGGKVSDTHCFEWVYGNKFIRDRHKTEGAPKPYEGETLYWWDGGEKAVKYMYWNSDGGVSTGTMVVSEDGSLHFPSRYREEGKEIELDSLWRRAGADSYTVSSRRKRDGAWIEVWNMTLRRQAR